MNIIFRLLLFLIVATTINAFGDTPPAGKVGAWIYDSGGNTLSSTTGALDAFITNSSLPVQFTSTIEMPVYVESVFSGTAIDPRARTWSLLNSTDSVTAYQGGSWTINVGNFPATFGVTQSTSPWVVSGSVSISNFPLTQPISGSVSVSNFPATQPVSGTVTANAGTGTFTVGQSTGSNLHVDVDSAPTTTVTGTVTANAGTGTFAISAASLPLPTGAATNSELITINSTLGSPFQAGGSIANTSFIATQTTGANLHTDVDNFPSTFGVTQSTSPWVVSGTVAATQSGAWTTGRTWTLLNSTDSVNAVQSGTWNLANITGTVSLPTGASTSANQTTGNTSLASILSNQTNNTQLVQSQPQTDSQPATQNVTAQDTVSSSATGANNQKFVSGSPSAGSTATFSISTLDTVRIQALGTWTGTLVTEVTLDGTNWFTNGVKQTGTAQTTSSFTGNFSGHMNVTGFTGVRIRSTTAWTGTATVLISKSYNTNAVSIASSVKTEDSQGSGSITSTAPVSISTSGASTLTLTVSGTWSASIQLLGANVLGATTGQQLWFRQVTGDDMNSFSTNATYCVDTSGFNGIVINPASFASGTLTYTYNTSQGANKNCGSGAQLISLGNGNKTLTMKTGELSTAATTANQVILTYTVPTGVTFYLQYFKCTANTEAAAVTATAFGSCQLQVGGTNVYQDWLHGSGQNGYPIGEQLSEPMPISAGTVIQWTTTPAAATAFFWYANFGGFTR